MFSPFVFVVNTFTTTNNHIIAILFLAIFNFMAFGMTQCFKIAFDKGEKLLINFLAGGYTSYESYSFEKIFTTAWSQASTPFSIRGQTPSCCLNEIEASFEVVSSKHLDFV